MFFFLIIKKHQKINQIKALEAVICIVFGPICGVVLAMWRSPVFFFYMFKIYFT